MSDDTEMRIRRRLAEYLGDPAAESRDVAGQYNALPVYSDVGGTLFLTPTSNVLCLPADALIALYFVAKVTLGNDVNSRIRTAMQSNTVQLSGSKASFANPLRIKVPK